MILVKTDSTDTETLLYISRVTDDDARILELLGLSKSAEKEDGTEIWKK